MLRAKTLPMSAQFVLSNLNSLSAQAQLDTHVRVSKGEVKKHHQLVHDRRALCIKTHSKRHMQR